MLVYVIRHGQSESNLTRRWTGWLDVPLTEQGRRDAQAAREYLKNIRFDKVWSSDLSRAMETARIALPDMAFKTTPLLREYNVGSLAAQPLSILTQEEMKNAVDNGYALFGGESKEDMYQRIRTMMQTLQQQNTQTVALFAHAGFLRGMADTVLGLRLPHRNLRCNNCTIAIFDYTDGIWQLHSWINLS